MKINRLVWVVLGLVVLAGILGFFFKYKNTVQQSATVNTSSYHELGFENQWPLLFVDQNPNSFLVRLVLETEVHTTPIPHGDLVIVAWNYGLYTNDTGEMQKIAVPRVWFHPGQKKLYYLGTLDTKNIPYLPPEKSFRTALTGLDQIFAANNKQRLVAAYVAPEDNSQEMISGFYAPISDWKLPPAFIQTGNATDLPYALGVGNYLPVTQLGFDVAK